MSELVGAMPYLLALQIGATNMRLQVTLILGLLSSVCVADQPEAGKQVEQTLELKDGGTVDYLIYLPKDYDGTNPTPTMLFLHGRGESFGPLSLVAKWGPPRMAARGDRLNFILVSPQCPKDDRWEHDSQQKVLIELLDHIQSKYKVDTDRVYLTGLSLGGHGSWRLASDHPQRFAAAAPVCGSGDLSKAKNLVSLPIWVFHGDKDTAVPYKDSVEMVAAIREAGGEKVRFTSLEHVGHNSWSAAYATPELFSWFAKQRASSN